jgi:hypothetical protein
MPKMIETRNYINFTILNRKRSSVIRKVPNSPVRDTSRSTYRIVAVYDSNNLMDYGSPTPPPFPKPTKEECDQREWL